MTANWAFCKLLGLLIGDFVGSKPQQEQPGQSMVVAMGAV
jgi:hypothetical protein